MAFRGHKTPRFCPLCRRIMIDKRGLNSKPTKEHILNWEHFAKKIPKNAREEQRLAARKQMDNPRNITTTCSACNDARNHAKQVTSKNDPDRYSAWSLLTLTEKFEKDKQVKKIAKEWTEDIDKKFWSYLATKHGVKKPKDA